MRLLVRYASHCFAIIAAVLLALGSLLSIREAGGPSSPMPLASADIQRIGPTQPRYSSKAIREIQPIADRVLADNPETLGQAPSDFGEFDRESWRIVRLEVPKPDGEWMRVTLARPVTWLEAAGRDDLGRLWLEFKELGVANWANVLAIEPCPEAEVGQGRLVTGKFEHSSADVIDLFVDSISEAIGTTSNHPFWSEDRQDFVQAGKLRIGERLRLRDGSTPVVTAAVQRSQSVPVFNLEVDGEHVYYVAASGVLVHNGDEEYTKKLVVNFGGEGEYEPNENEHVINVRPSFGGNAEAIRNDSEFLRGLIDQDAVAANGDQMPFADGSVDKVVGNNIPPLDAPANHFGVPLTSKELERILKEGGEVTGTIIGAPPDLGAGQ